MAMYKFICLHVDALISPDMIFWHSWLYSPKMQEPWIMKQSLYNFRDQELDFDYLPIYILGHDFLQFTS